MKFEPDWPRWLPQEPYRFHLGLSPEKVEDFFAPTDLHDSITAERIRWLQDSLDSYCQLDDEAHPLLDEIFALAHDWGLPVSQQTPTAPCSAIQNPWLDRCLMLGSRWEPDFLLLKSNPDGIFRLVGGVVCFPSSWSLPDKMGLGVAEIHSIVPSLNSSIGRQIDTFLKRILPGNAWARVNWGLNLGADLNRHPKRALPILTSTTPLTQIYLRVEHQIFYRLPHTLGLLFGIRLSFHPLQEVMANPKAKLGLWHALTTMPTEIAQYKGLSLVRAQLLQTLQ